MQFADPSLSHPSRCSRARWPTKCQKKGWASRSEFRVLSLGLPGDTRLLGKTVQTEILQQRGGAVKALTPRARPFCNLQVGELRECANRGRNTWFPAPRSPSSLTCGPQPSAAPTGWRSLGTQERTKWAFPAAVATPESAIGTDPHLKPSESRPAQPGFTQSRVRSRRVFSLSVHLREHNWEARPHPRQKPNPAPRRPRSHRPCTVQVPSQLLAFTPG